MMTDTKSIGQTPSSLERYLVIIIIMLVVISYSMVCFTLYAVKLLGHQQFLATATDMLFSKLHIGRRRR